MTEPQWLSLAVVMAIHEAQIAEHGGRLGVRDEGLLESALARPRNLRVYGEAASLSRLAAAYAFGIAKDHPFADGNKRTAWVVCATFLEFNGSEVFATQADVVRTVSALAAGDVDETAFADWLERNCR